ncbi:glycosyltransferase [Microbacterium sp. NPDC090007]|uniref:glycosyltransferase n=1 Tax=Microbacterium sp. NPDC090007 TaxID=3364204 RepID=UPI0037F50145
MTLFPRHDNPGIIVLAAYKPDPDLFARQLRSIQAQTVASYRCLVTSDGAPGATEALMRSAIGDDPRFEILGFDERLGFYLNFERGLAAVPRDAPWVALSDQDDYWYPQKIETLLPHLTQFAAVAGQARVIQHPSGKVVMHTTGRRNVEVADFMLDNQYTGGQMLFRASVLEVALPFPRLHTPAQVHDHWIAVCAAFVGGSCVVDSVIQDYVQHGGNVIGESTPGFSPRRSIANARRIAQRYEGRSDLRGLSRAIYRVGIGWRETMVEALSARVSTHSPDLDALRRLYGRDRKTARTALFLFRSARRGAVSVRSLAEYLAGAALSPIYRPRR